MATVTARCPVRIDLAGGTTDIWPLPLVLSDPVAKVMIVNVALDLPATARVTPLSDTSIELISVDLKREVRYADAAELRAALTEDNCPLPLLGLAAVHATEDPSGLRIETEAGSPSGAGLGGSSALLVALVGALQAVRETELSNTQHLRLAQNIETALLGTPTGFQDYYPPLHGGCLALSVQVNEMTCEHVPLDLKALSKRLRVVYTGAPHHSGITNWGVVRAWFEKDGPVRDAMRAIAANARQVAQALRTNDVDAALLGVIEDGRIRRALGEEVVTPQIQALDEQVRAAGALGTKVLGAGGGGCVLVVLADGDDGAVDAVLDSSARMPADLTETGMTVVTE